MTTPPTPPRDSRTLNRDGTYNIERRGMPHRRFSADAYHHLLGLDWRLLVAYIGGAYVLVNSLFALAYLALGNAIENARHGSFEDAFFFSVQTMATIGYGKMVPSGFAGNALVTVESLLGMLGVAVLTGLLFAKFSRPISGVMFSRHAVVTNHNGVPALSFRVANGRDSMIVEARMRVVVIRGERTAEGVFMRRFHDLAIARSETPIFPLSWTVTHIIDQKSPLWSDLETRWDGQDIEIVCALAGTEESIAQAIHARFSYTVHDIRFGHRLVDIISAGPDGKRVLDYRGFHDTVDDGTGVGSA